MEEHTNVHQYAQVSRLLGRCGMGEILERMKLYKGGGGSTGGSPVSDPELSLQRIADAMRSFFVLVSSPDSLPEFRQIQAPRTRAEAVAQVRMQMDYDLM